MSLLKMPENTPVSVDHNRCKSCDICVDVCPTGVLAMIFDPTTTLGKTVKIIAPQDCIGCKDCELECPDFAIFVAEKSEYKFAKVTKDAMKRAEDIRKNNYMILD